MKSFLFVFFTWIISTHILFAQNTPLLYGDLIYLQNGWRDFNGSYLDTRNYDTTGNHLAVSTCYSNNRDNGSGTWKILSATGKANGTPVSTYDEIYLLNAFNQFSGGYLDTKGLEQTGNYLNVSTSLSNDRDRGSGKWRILPVVFNPASVELNSNNVVHLQNCYIGSNGGYLDTKNPETNGNHLKVSTSHSNNRDNGSGSWKLIKLNL